VTSSLCSIPGGNDMLFLRSIVVRLSPNSHTATLESANSVELASGIVVRLSKSLEFRPSQFDQLWQLITFATEVHRGSTLMSKKGLNVLYKLLKTRISSPKGFIFFSPLNLVKNSKTRVFSLLKFPKSSLGMNFKRGILCGFLTFSLEMNLGHQSNIYL
jgi:hypothetical protein